MTKDEARDLILEEWPRWKAANPRNGLPIGNYRLQFFKWLEKESPRLLSFRSTGDKWQVVKGWLEDHDDRC